ncbi:MAG: hypothetical protein JNJ88_15825 [Planctomycetes bacterium]|nr:hypothetical protein [Planctomycetota bacterium]
MLNIQRSTSRSGNTELKREPRGRHRNNLAWMEAHLADQRRSETMLLLVGGCDATGFRLRVAQSHARRDLSPSVWSHAALIANPQRLATGVADLELFDVPLEENVTLQFPPKTNGVQKRTLGAFRDGSVYPNIALIQIPLAWAEVEKAIGRFRATRSAADVPELMLRWFSFLWGVARAGNPLHDGAGIPSAVFADAVLSACGLDLSPGLASRGTCPEALWQSVRFWQDYYKDRAPQGREATEPFAMTGFFEVSHPLHYGDRGWERESQRKER